MPVVMCICHLALSIIPSGILRTWVYASAWRGFSRTRIRKIRRDHSFAARMTLVYLYIPEAKRETKKRILLYWLYGAMVVLGGILWLFSGQSEAIHTAASLFFFLIRGVELTAWILWRIHGRPMY